MFPVIFFLKYDLNLKKHVNSILCGHTIDKLFLTKLYSELQKRFRYPNSKVMLLSLHALMSIGNLK